MSRHGYIFLLLCPWAGEAQGFASDRRRLGNRLREESMLKVELHKWSEPGEYQAESALADKMKGPECFRPFLWVEL